MSDAHRDLVLGAYADILDSAQKSVNSALRSPGKYSAGQSPSKFSNTASSERLQDSFHSIHGAAGTIRITDHGMEHKKSSHSVAAASLSGTSVGSPRFTGGQSLSSTGATDPTMGHAATSSYMSSPPRRYTHQAGPGSPFAATGGSGWDAAGSAHASIGRDRAVAQLKAAMQAANDEADALRTAVARHEESSQARALLDEDMCAALLLSEARIEVLQQEVAMQQAQAQAAQDEARRAQDEALLTQQGVRTEALEQGSALQGQIEALQHEVASLQQEKGSLEAVVTRGREAALANAVRSTNPGAYLQSPERSAVSMSSPLRSIARLPLFSSSFGQDAQGSSVHQDARNTAVASMGGSYESGDAAPSEQEDGGRPPIKRRAKSPGMLSSLLLSTIMVATRRGSIAGLSGQGKLRSPLPPSAAHSRRSSVAHSPLRATLGRTWGAHTAQGSMVITAPLPDPAIVAAAVEKATKETIQTLFGRGVTTIADARVRLEMMIAEEARRSAQAVEGSSASLVVVQSTQAEHLRRQLTDVNRQLQATQDEGRKAQAERLSMALQLQRAKEQLISAEQELEDVRLGAREGTTLAILVQAEVDKRLVRLNNQLASSAAGESSAHARVHALTQELVDVKEKLQALQLKGEGHGAALYAAQQEAHATLMDVRAQLESAHAELARSEGEIGSLRSLVGEERAGAMAAGVASDIRQAEKLELQRTIDALQQGMAGMQSEAAAAKAESEIVKAQLWKAEDTFAMLRQEADSLRAAGQAREGQVQAELDQATANRETLEAHIQQLTAAVARERGEVQSLCEQVEIARANEDRVACKLMEAQEDVAAGDANLGKLQKQLNAAQRSMASLQIMMDGRASEAAASRAAAVPTIVGGSISGSSVFSPGHTVQRTSLLEAEVRGVRQDAASSRAELQLEKSKSSALIAQVASLQAEVQHLKGSLLHARGDEGLHQDLYHARVDVERARKERDACELSLGASQHVRAGLEAQLGRLEQQVVDSSFSTADFAASPTGSASARNKGRALSFGSPVRASSSPGHAAAVVLAGTLSTDELVARVADLALELERVKASAEAERGVLQGALNDAQRARDDLQAKLELQESELVTLRAALTSAEAHVSGVDARLEVASRELETAQEQAQAHRKAAADMQQSMQSKPANERRSFELELELRNSRSELSAAVSKAKEAALGLQLTRADLAASQAKATRMQSELALAQAEAASARREVTIAQSSISSVREVKQLLEGKVRTLEEQLQAVAGVGAGLMVGGGKAAGRGSRR